MSVSNPFQIPSCLQRADFQQRRQARFKKIVVASVIAGASGLVALLIAGCVSEKSKTTAMGAPAIVPVQPAETIAAEPKSAPTFPLTPAVTPSIVTGAPAELNQSAKPVANVQTPVYIVKPGDTLSHIARQYHTTIKSLKEANALVSDKIVAGMTLKLPTA